MRSRLATFALGILLPSAARAEDVERPPLPESLLTESATDVDAAGAGEIELEANLGTVGARSGGAHATLTSVEVEWRILRDFGVRLEPSYAREVGVGASGGRDRFGIGGAAAFGIFHDFPRDIHLQLEAAARTTDHGDARVFEPSDTTLPISLDLVGAARRGRFTLRSTVGAEAGEAIVHAPVHTDFALLTGIRREERFGFVAIEARADWARKTPLVLAPELVADLSSVGLPFRIGAALPVNLGAARSETSYGVFFRLTVLTGREAAEGRAM